MRSAVIAALVVAGLWAPGPARADRFATSAGPVAVERIAGPFAHPWGLAFLPSGATLVTERGGRLLLVEAGEARPVSGAPEVWARGQGGLLDVAVSDDFRESALIYMTFSETAEEGARTAAARARLVIGDAPRLEDLTVIFRQSAVDASAKHFGARLAQDGAGALFITVGDRMDRQAAQDLSNHKGKVIRIRPDGGVPADNPFVGAEEARPEIWSIGHRNIQGAAIEPATGALWVADHGPRGGDEINRPEPGANYGWPVISYGVHYSGAKIGEGTAKGGMEQPAYHWAPSVAPSGLAFYDGALFPGWRGDLFVGALRGRQIMRLDLEDGAIVAEERLFSEIYGRVRDVRTGPDGALWFLTDAENGALYRAAPAKPRDPGVRGRGALSP